jgi:hypothetical protein
MTNHIKNQTTTKEIAEKPFEKGKSSLVMQWCMCDVVFVFFDEKGTVYADVQC